MGALCCVSAKDRTLSSRSTGASLTWNVSSHSPSRSCHGRVEPEAENGSSRYRSGVLTLQTKGGVEEHGDVSIGSNPLVDLQLPTQQTSSNDRGVDGDSVTPASETLVGSPLFTEVKELRETSADAGPLASRLSFSIPVTSSSSMSKVESLPSQSHVLSADSTPSRKACRSPGHQFFRQVSSGRIPGFRSPNNSTSEGRGSLVLSPCSNDATMGSQGRSSDGWSMCTFSEFVTSSQRQRSFDSESFDSARGKITRSNSKPLHSPSVDQQTCGVCSKLLTDRPPWMGHKMIISYEILVVAVLVCGHVYHAECLESMTPEADKFDPPCPMCINGNKLPLKMYSKSLSDTKARNRVARNRVFDSDLDEEYAISDKWKNSGRSGKGPKMAPGSSTLNSFAKPFFRRHFSLGSRSSKSMMLENESSERAPNAKGFWARYRKE